VAAAPAAQEGLEMGELVLAIGIAVWTGAAALLVALGRTAAQGEAVQTRLFRKWLARHGTARRASETAGGDPLRHARRRAA
jgi:hypothetical protein